MIHPLCMPESHFTLLKLATTPYFLVWWRLIFCIPLLCPLLFYFLSLSLSPDHSSTFFLSLFHAFRNRNLNSLVLLLEKNTHIPPPLYHLSSSLLSVRPFVRRSFFHPFTFSLYPSIAFVPICSSPFSPFFFHALPHCSYALSLSC